ncbi:MAG: glutamate--tRNA ligase [Ignisphaera sp.]
MSLNLPEELKGQIRRNALAIAVANRLKYGQAKLEPVANKVFGEFKEIRQYARDVIAVVREVINYINSLNIEEVKRIAEELGALMMSEERIEVKTLPSLPGVETWGKVTTRFAPNPDFPIHLGNARAAIISYIYAVMYKGKFILRFEDTDPRIKKPLPEAYNVIREDLKWLGIKWDEEYIQSLRMGIYYDYLKKLIANGYAYVDLCKPELFRELRNKGIACPHRNDNPSVNLERLDKIFAQEYKEGEAVIRLKTDLGHPDPSVRDWVLFRVIDTTKHPHPITGDRYVLWPTYNFAAAVDDHQMNISHIFRGREHAVNTIKQMYLYNCFGWRYPEVINLGRVGLEKSILSKTWIKTQLVSNPGKFMGIDDIRFGTIAALRRRGISPETIKQLILELGVKGIDAIISWENVAAVNRKLLDPVSKRIFIAINPVKVEISNLNIPTTIKIPYHPSSNLGFREYRLSRPEIYISSNDAVLFKKIGFIRLMEFTNIGFIEEKDNKIIAENIGGDVETAKKLGAQIVQWVPAESAVKIRMLKAHGLNLVRMLGVGEGVLKQLGVGEVVQMVRLGFGRIDDVRKNLISIIYAHD